MTEAIPIPVTALLPVVLYPLFGISDTGEILLIFCVALLQSLMLIYLLQMTLAENISRTRSWFSSGASW